MLKENSRIFKPLIIRNSKKQKDGWRTPRSSLIISNKTIKIHTTLPLTCLKAPSRTNKTIKMMMISYSSKREIETLISLPMVKELLIQLVRSRQFRQVSWLTNFKISNWLSKMKLLKASIKFQSALPLKELKSPMKNLMLSLKLLRQRPKLKMLETYKPRLWKWEVEELFQVIYPVVSEEVSEEASVVALVTWDKLNYHQWNKKQWAVLWEWVNQTPLTLSRNWMQWTLPKDNQPIFVKPCHHQRKPQQ